MRMALLKADVALPVVKDFIARVKERPSAPVISSLTPGQALVGVENRELTDLMGGAHGAQPGHPAAGDHPDGRPAGRGKTTTTGKLGKMPHRADEEEGAHGLHRHLPPGGHRPVEDGGQQAGIVPPPRPTRSRWTRRLAAVDYARRHYFDVLLVDTAGRLAIDQVMMEDRQALHATVKPIRKPCSSSMRCSARMR